MIVEIPRANPLRFVNMYEYNTNMYTHENRLLQDEGLDHNDGICYFQKYSTNDGIRVQLRTDYSNITLKIYDLTDSLCQIVTLNDQNAGLGNNVKILEGLVNTSILGGVYYAKIEAQGVGLITYTFKSEYFEIDDFSKTALIQWSESSYSGLYFGSSQKFGFRIDANIINAEYEEDADSFQAFNSSIVNLKSTTRRVVIFKTDPIPRYIYEKLILAFAHKKVWVNSIEYVSTGTSANVIDNTLMYQFEKKITQANYEVYDTFDGSSGGGGEAPESGTSAMSSDGVKMRSIDGVKGRKPF